MPFLYYRNSSRLRFSETIIASEIHGLRSLVKDINFSLIFYPLKVKGCMSDNCVSVI